MTLHDDEVRLRHMLDYSREALELVKDRSRTDLDSDRVLELALVRLLEIIGEAANRVSEEGRERNTEIPWSQIISLRNRLIHGYDSIDMDVLWEILQSDLPALILKLEEQND
ncbi:MAG: HepT-like ribonuclease domain-containing protein [Thermoleophilia bacterium]